MHCRPTRSSGRSARRRSTRPPSHAWDPVVSARARPPPARYCGGRVAPAREYRRTQTRPWIHAIVDAATEDPDILATYGDLMSRVQRLAALAERAERAAAWELDRPGV